MVNIFNIISKKKNGVSALKSELESFINQYVSGSISDKEMTPWLQAVFKFGMSPRELKYFTQVMVDSGQRMDFSHLGKFVADKHSTGGVGDKVSLILAPLLASAGMAIPMISGRALGHTGGTLDKLESIPRFSTQLPLKQFKEQVERVGVSMIGQTNEICPADKKMYALRDATGTVESLPLIVASIMSKKISEGLNGLVLDVKTGNGAFMRTLDASKELGNLLKETGKYSGIKTDVIYSNMNQPLGRFSGCWCEVKESIECLNGTGPKDTIELTLRLASTLMVQANLSKSFKEAKASLKKLLKQGKAFTKFIEMVEAQGGDIQSIFSSEKFNIPSEEIIIKSKKSGFVELLDTYSIGIANTLAGCGYTKPNDTIDHTAGLECFVKIGTEVKIGDPIFRIFNSKKSKLLKSEKKLINSVTIGHNQKTEPLIFN